MNTGFDYTKYSPVGIDFGTTNSILAKYTNTQRKQNTAEPFNHNINGLEKDSRFFPSMVFGEKTDSKLQAGKHAYSRRISYPEKVASSIKRKISTRNVCFSINDNNYAPHELLNVIIKDLFKDPLRTEHNLKPEGIVATVPYYYTQTQIENTRLGIENALKEIYPTNTPELLELLPEPVAAAISFIHENLSGPVDNQIGLVFDLGGGTLDITLFRYNISRKSILFEVLASSGIAQLGGDDFDKCLEDLIIEKTQFQINTIPSDKLLRQKSKIREVAVSCKEIMSITLQTQEDVFFISEMDGTPYTCNISVSDFESLLNGKNVDKRNFVSEIKQLISSVLSTSGINPTDVNTLLLVGGASKTLSIKDLVISQLPSLNTVEMINDDAVFYGVAKGAALYCAHVLDQKFESKHFPFGENIETVKIITRSTFDLGIKLSDGSTSILVPENTPVPIAKQEVYYPISSFLNDSIIKLDPLKIIQGKNGESQVIGSIPFPDIYTHGRNANNNDIKVVISFACNTTKLDVSIYIQGSDSKKNDIHIKNALKLSLN